MHRGVEKCPLETKRKYDRFSSRSIFLLRRCLVNIKGERSYSINSVINVRELSLHEYHSATLDFRLVTRRYTRPVLRNTACKPLTLAQGLPDYGRTHNDNRFLLLLSLSLSSFSPFSTPLRSARILYSRDGSKRAKRALSNSGLKTHRFTSLHVPCTIPRNVDRGGVNGEIYLSPGNPAG